MAAVTQTVPNFLGGISTQTDQKKVPGQLTEALNAYPDPTFGMLKRNGTRFIRTLNKADGTPFTDAELENAAWFFIQRDSFEAYFGCIKDQNIYVWNAITGVFCTVTNNGASYLSVGVPPATYHFRSVQDTTVVTNRSVAPELEPKPTGYAPGKVGEVVLKVVEYSANYTVTIDGVDYTYKTRNSDEFEPGNTDTKLNADEVLTGLNNAITASVSVEQYATSLCITSSSPFTLEGKGGVNNQAIETFQDTVTDISKLPPESNDQRYVEVVNSSGNEDNYWLRFVAETEEWKESRSPTSSPGMVASTMPHELTSTDENTFTFGPISWRNREAGDDITNPPPSIFPYDEATKTYTSPGNFINATFFYNNRFGLLSQDNVILSQANDPYNLFYRSALAQIDSDPIDINASSVRPVDLFDVLPDAQGLLLFSKRQQFLLYATSTNQLTPKTAMLRSISNYEMDSAIPPVDIGTTVGFLSRVPAYTRAFALQTRGLEENPIVTDISKVISEYLPNSITELTSSPQNSFIALAGRDTEEVFIYRFYNDGEKDLFQAWTRWSLPGDVQAISVFSDMMLVVTEQMDQYSLGVISINDIPLNTKFSGNENIEMANPLLDMASKPTSVTYDSGTNLTTFGVDYKPLDYKQAVLLLTLPTSQAFSNLDSLAAFNAEPYSESDDTGYWQYLDIGTGNTFTLRGDWTSYANRMIIGYNYLFDIELPTFYYNRAQQGATYDFTASLTIARAHFSCGKSGALTFKVKANGSEEWVDVQAVSDANYYQASTNPVVSSKDFTVPINQRNMNFSLKLTSDHPYPVSINSMMWEGNYSPRYYKRT